MQNIDEYPNVRFVFDRRKKATATNPGGVEIEISFKGRRKWISTGVRVLLHNWHPQMMVIGVVNAFELNSRLRDSISKITNYIQLLIVNNREFEWQGLESYIEAYNHNESFILFAKNHNEKRSDIREGTRKCHRSFISLLEKYGKIIKFSDLTSEAIKQYDKWLKSDSNRKQSTIVANHRLFKYYVGQALKMEHITKNPYRDIKIERPKTSARKYLTLEELALIEDFHPEKITLKRATDLFLFQCYTGLAYADVSNFDWKKVEHRGDKYIYHGRRQKTNTDFYIVLLQKGIDILKRYNYKLPSIHISHYTSRLGSIGELLGLSKKLTSHVARHTFACLCLNNNIRIEVLARMLGHTDIKTTQIYAKLYNSTIEDAFDQLELGLNRHPANQGSKDTEGKD